MNRKQMIDDLSRKLNEWDERLEATEQKLGAKKDEAKARVEKERALLKERRVQLKSRLKSAEQSADAGWERTSESLRDAWEEFQDAAKNVVESVRG